MAKQTIKHELSKSNSHFTDDHVLLVQPGESTDIDYTVKLDSKNLHSQSRFRAIVANSGSLKLVGKIHISTQARLANANLDMRVLLLGTSAQAIATPELEIETNDVQATHAAAVGQLDAIAMITLQLRGFSPAQSRTILAKAFIMPLLKDLPDNQASEKLAILKTMTEVSNA